MNVSHLHVKIAFRIMYNVNCLTLMLYLLLNKKKKLILCCIIKCKNKQKSQLCYKNVRAEYSLRKGYESEPEINYDRRPKKITPRKYEGIGQTTRSGIPICIRSVSSFSGLKSDKKKKKKKKKKKIT